MDTTVAKSAKRQSAPARPKAASTVKSATSKKAAQSATAKRPKATAGTAKAGKKSVAKAPQRAASKKAAVKDRAKKAVSPAKRKAAPVTKKPVAANAKKAVAAKATRPKPKPAEKKRVAAKAPARAPKRIAESQKQAQAQQKSHQAALKLYEQALRAFHRHDYVAACEGFTRILQEFSADIEVASRARDYTAICEQRMERPKSSAPRSSETLYSQGIYELNAGQYEKAATLLERAAKLEPHSAYIFYSLAAAQAQISETEAALDNLRQAISLEESLRIRARRDPDFTSLMESEEFRRLIGMELPPPLVL